VDVRLIAATHQDLRQLIESKGLSLRSLLPHQYGSLSQSLRCANVPEDIPAIAHNLMQRIATDMGRPNVDLSPRAVQRLSSYYWPGNIREMRNVLERGAAADGSFRPSMRRILFFDATAQKSSGWLRPELDDGRDGAVAHRARLFPMRAENVEKNCQAAWDRQEHALPEAQST